MLGFTSKINEEASKTTEGQQLVSYHVFLITSCPILIKKCNLLRKSNLSILKRNWLHGAKRNLTSGISQEHQKEKDTCAFAGQSKQKKSQKETSTEGSYNKASNTLDLSMIKCNTEEKRARVPEKDGSKKNAPSWSKQRPRAIQMRSHGQK